MTDSKTISAYDSQIDNYLEVIKQQPEDPLLINFIVGKLPWHIKTCFAISDLVKSQAD